MPKARPRYQARLDDVVDRAVDVGVDAVFDRLGSFFENTMNSQRAQTQALPPESRRAKYKCSGCHLEFTFDEMAMVGTKNDGWGTCERCFAFMWHAGNEKMLAIKNGVGNFAKGAARGARGAPPPHAAPQQPAGRAPNEVLGVSIDASVEEIKKAYKTLALKWHPDRVPPGEPTEVSDMHRAKFEEIQRAYNVMMKVRKVAT